MSFRRLLSVSAIGLCVTEIGIAQHITVVNIGQGVRRVLELVKVNHVVVNSLVCSGTDPESDEGQIRAAIAQM